MQAHPRALLIFLYFDEVQLCNPLGSKTQHKLVFCYITLLNFPARFCSSLKAVWLVEIYYAKINVAFNMDLILKPIVDDLKKLDDGCVFSIFGETKTIYGTLTAVIEDNLASHEIGGFKNAFGHGFLKCRTCIASAEEIQVALCEESCQLRTIDEHDLHCRMLLLNTSLSEHFSKIYGVKFRSIFNELKYFHVIGGLPPDIMHDLLEGIVPLVVIANIKSLLKIGQHGFKLAELNKMIANFKYGLNEIRDRPSEITVSQLKSGPFGKLRRKHGSC